MGDSVFVTLERWSSRLYLVAAAVMVVFVLNTALRLSQGTAYPVVQEFVAPAGFFVGLVGLMGLYRGLSRNARRLAQASLALAALSALNWGAIVVAGVLETANIVPENTAFQAITGILALFSMILAYGLFGITSTMTGTYRRIIGALLLLEAVTFVAMFVNKAAGIGAPVIVFELSHLVVYLGIGVVHSGEGGLPDRADQATDTTV
ncbi:hypothetical protein [Haloarchaeobius baliensis]|uniref:hypothetical protein n=1 Tax=Haloarchaeobius baliensis TaxID=1670458 RepID=UPI003F8836DF